MKTSKFSFLTALILSTAVSQAQDAPFLRKGNVEGNVFGGASYGVDTWRGSFGGNVAYAINRNIMPYGEFSYFPGIGRSTSANGVDIRYSLPVQDYHAGVHYRIPIGQSRIVPYLVIAAGAIRSSETTLRYEYRLQGIPVQGTLNLASETSFGVNGGAGIRYYVLGERAGFRTEAKIYKPTGTFSEPFYKVSFGLFYQFR